MATTKTVLDDMTDTGVCSVLGRMRSNDIGIDYRDAPTGLIDVYLEGGHAARIDKANKRVFFLGAFEKTDNGNTRLGRLVDHIEREGYENNLVFYAPTDGGSWSYGDKPIKGSLAERDFELPVGLSLGEGRGRKERFRDEPAPAEEYLVCGYGEETAVGD